MNRFVLGTVAALGMGLTATPAMAVNELILSNNYDDPTYLAPGVGLFASDAGEEMVATNPIGGWSGTFVNVSTTELGYLTLSNLPTHTGVSLSFILGFMNSWDSYDGGCCSPDILSFYIDGSLVGQMTYDNVWGYATKDIDGSTLLSEFGQHGAGVYYSDTLIDVSTASFATFAHTADTLTFGIQAGGGGWQGGGDESWGIDDIKVTLLGVERAPAVPEPATWAMMLAGFGAVGYAMRRRRNVAVSFA